MPLNRSENHHNIIKTGIDGPLTTRGVAEAEALGRALADVKFTKVYSSDFQRARQTAEWILKNSSFPDVEITLEKRVRERDSGEWEEKTPVDMYMAAVAAQTYPHFLPCEKGESVETVCQRAGEFFEELCNASDATSAEELVLVTTHGALFACFIEFLIASALKGKYVLENFDEKKAREPAPTTGVTQFRIGKLNSDGIRTLSFVQLHDQTHLANQVLPD